LQLTAKAHISRKYFYAHIDSLPHSR